VVAEKLLIDALNSQCKQLGSSMLGRRTGMAVILTAKKLFAKQLFADDVAACLSVSLKALSKGAATFF